MALYKALRGTRDNLPTTKTDGWVYFCIDDGSYWLDYKDANGVLQRKQVDAGTVNGHTVEADVPADAVFTDTVTIVDSALSSTSTNPVQNKVVNTKFDEVQASIDSKVDSVDGKGLSTNDYTSEEKEKLAGIEDGANKTTVDSSLSSTSTNPVQNKVINTKFTSVQSDIDSKVPNTRTVNGKALSANITLSASDVGALPNTTVIPSIDGLATESYVDTKVAGLVDSAPSTLDTLNELAAALGDDPNFATTVATQIGEKVDKVDGKGLSTNDLTDALKSNYNTAYTHSQDPHNYAGSSTSGGAATSANKLNTDAGSTTQPVYFKNGVPTVINELDSAAFDGYVTKGKKYGTTVGSRATAEGYGTTASGNYSHAEGSDTISSGQDSHAEGYRTTASGSSSHAEGFSDNIVPETITSDSSKDDIITAWNTSKFALARGSYAHIEGWSNLALGSASHAEGKTTIAKGNWSHTEGIGTETGEDGTHAEGWDTKATDYAAHSEGRSTVASGKNSHSEGYGTTASGESSHAEGVSTVASGRGSHAEGEGTIANTALQHVEGKYNVKDFVTYVHIVGNGTSDTNRSNAHTLDWSGNAWYAGKVSVGTTDNIKDPTADNELVTKKYVDSKTGGIEDFSLDADAWNGTESPYSQVVTLSGVTANSKVDIQPTAEQLNSLATNRTILNTANDNGTVTVYAIGNKPTESYTMQATITGV